MQPPECSWNADFRPYAACLTYPYPDPFVCTESCGNHPQVCVNWCDAYAYCKWAGKRLCGATGGGPTDPSKFNDPAESQWANACTSGGRHTYPYGDGFVRQRCQTYAIAEGGRTTSAVGSHPDCQSRVAGHANVLDLSGNVSEWEDDCVAAGTSIETACNVRGGSFLDETKTRCDTQFRIQRNRTEPDVGFRCCGP